MSEYYLQDSRAYVGISLLWHRKFGAGYTTDLGEAHVFTKREALAAHANRDSDVPWPKSYIDARATLHVDAQRVRQGELPREGPS